MPAVNVKLYHIALNSTYTWGSEREEFDKKVAEYKAAGFETKEWVDGDHSHNFLANPEALVVDGARIIELAVLGIDFKVKAEVKTLVDISQELEEWAAKPVNLLAGPSSANYNNKCEVHIPGQALSTYNDLMLAEDVCTDVLQGHLNGGWRIIAACPQPDQRRPDYILGRFNPDVRVDGKGADRS